MIHVLADITTLVGKRGNVLKLFCANLPTVKAEASGIEYAAVNDNPVGLASQLGNRPIDILRGAWPFST